MDALTAYPNTGTTGYTWTIASRISDALHKAETLYGPRDTSYFFAGFEFGPTNPRVWYPGDRKHIVIQLSSIARVSFPHAIYQLAHEVVHLLAPSGGRNANVLEEGLATHFSEIYLQEAANIVIHPGIPSYAVARDLLRQLLSIDGDAIRKLRQREPKFYLMTADLITAVIPGVPKKLAEQLAAPFNRDATT